MRRGIDRHESPAAPPTRYGLVSISILDCFPLSSADKLQTISDMKKCLPFRPARWLQRLWLFKSKKDKKQVSKRAKADLREKIPRDSGFSRPVDQRRIAGRVMRLRG